MDLFSLETKLVGITSNGGTNLTRCTKSLESDFDNTGMFKLSKPMFVMKCLYHVLEIPARQVSWM